MHEYSVVQALLDQIAAVARPRSATSVHGVRVGLGELSGVDPELLASAWETFRERTICANAPLELHRVAALWSCPSCGERIPRGHALRCGLCSEPARLVQGDELTLESVDLEIPDGGRDVPGLRLR
jgi:hydrogenase nickel incorporation protein HypA/HybF